MFYRRILLVLTLACLALFTLSACNEPDLTAPAQPPAGGATSAPAPVATNTPAQPSAGPTNTPAPTAAPQVTISATPTRAAVTPSPVPPSATPLRPTATPVPPTATPVKPTATPLPSNHFLVSIKTGDVALAGTTANVFLTLYGSLANSDEKLLNPLTSKPFTQFGQTAEVRLTTGNQLGKIERVRIRHDNTGLNPGWFLDYILVENTDTKASVLFKANRWLAKGEGDGKIDITLTASN